MADSGVLARPDSAGDADGGRRSTPLSPRGGASSSAGAASAASAGAGAADGGVEEYKSYGGRSSRQVGGALDGVEVEVDDVETKGEENGAAADVAAAGSGGGAAASARSRPPVPPRRHSVHAAGPTQKVCQVLGTDPEQIARTKALQRMGVTETELDNANHVFGHQHKDRATFRRRYSTNSSADKALNFLGASEEEVLHAKALRTLGVSEYEFETQRSILLSNPMFLNAPAPAAPTPIPPVPPPRRYFAVCC